MKQREYIFLSIARNKKRKFFLDEIIYCKADNIYTTLKLINGETFLISKPIKEYDTLLYSANFFKISRSLILNLHYVIELETGCKPRISLVNNDKVIPDKNKVKQIEAKLHTSQCETSPLTR